MAAVVYFRSVLTSLLGRRHPNPVNLEGTACEI